ncbi:MAG: M3 family metallopeptidase [Bacteroidales bacterium]|nr:M3 family metallopeptidase [Bacteroidales bacterium]
MKKLLMLTLSAGVLLGVFSCKEKNPLLTDYNTPFNVPPFDKIKVEHYEPAFIEAMKQQKQAIDKIVNSTEEPTFENTIEALEYSGGLLSEVASVFYPLTSANTNPQMQELAQKFASMLSSHGDDISLDPELFKRVKAVYDSKEELELNPEQQMLLRKVYNGFVKGGANLPEDKQARFREINEALAMLTVKFGNNVLAETNSYQMVVEDEADLAGLPESVKQAAAEVAKDAGLEDKWVFTLHNPSLIPFLEYAENRELREKIFRANSLKGNNGDDKDNKEIITQIVPLRLERAQLLGYPTHSHYILEDNMAKNPETVNGFLASLWEPAIKRAKTEAYDIQKMIDDEGGKFRLEPWDWSYYAEKVREQKYDLDQNALKPYFSLEGVKKGIFLLSQKLYGLQFEKLTNIPIYHPDVVAYEVKEADGSHIGILYMDFYPRESKISGAWMTEYRGQHVTPDGNFVPPVITIVTNFTRPTADKPALLSLDEAQTFFHEFGHALHGLLANSTYPRLAGTNVSRDFVELPSQIMENWSTDPEFLGMYAFHYQTGEVIPTELVEKMKASGTFNQGFATTEFLAAAILDMNYHTVKQINELDAIAFEKDAMDKIGLIDEIIPRYRSTYFQHIFSGGYSSGYYSYIWSGQLDADAYEAFKETGNIFDPETASRFRTLLEKGATVDPAELYREFRGAEPNPEALLRQRGLL